MRSRPHMQHSKAFMRRTTYCMYCPADDDCLYNELLFFIESRDVYLLSGC